MQKMMSQEFPPGFQTHQDTEHAKTKTPYHIRTKSEGSGVIHDITPHVQISRSTTIQK